MSRYSFVCEQHGEHIASIRASQLNATHPCPACHHPSRRIYVAPLLNLGDSKSRRLIDATKATADAPPIVSSLPGRPTHRQKIARDPRLQKLPRPN